MKKTILFVDDEEINLFVLEKRFEADYNILTASSAMDAVEKIRSQNGILDAIITDFKMPDMNGLQVLEQCKEALNGVPCFLLTGYDNNDEINDALESKTIERLFKKPFNYTEIKNTLKEYL